MTNQAKPSQAKLQWAKLGLFANLLLPNFVFATTSPTSPPVDRNSIYTAIQSDRLTAFPTENFFSAGKNVSALLERQLQGPINSIQKIIAIISQDIGKQTGRLEDYKPNENTPGRDQQYMREKTEEVKEIIDYLTRLKAELEGKFAILSQLTAQRATPE